MYFFGGTLMLGGIIAAVVGGVMDVTVRNGVSTVNNLGLIHQAQITVLIGGFAFLGGCVLLSAGAIRSAIRKGVEPRS